jgi:uncharacterized protein DUF4386
MSIARLAGVVYVLVFVTGGYALGASGSRAAAAGLAAGALYAAVTILFYLVFKPVNRVVSALAALVSLAGIVAGPALRINPLPIFGVYCLTIGWLVYRSTFLPRVLGVLLMFAGAGWLTFLSPALSRSLVPYNYLPGILGEGALTLWLVVFGANGPSRDVRLDRQASVSASCQSPGHRR